MVRRCQGVSSATCVLPLKPHPHRHAIPNPGGEPWRGRAVRERLRCFPGFRDSGFGSSPLDPGTRFRFKLPAWIFFPLAAQICPVRILGENQFQLLCPTPAFDLDFAHPCVDDVPKRLTPDKHVELVSRGEAIRIEFVLVLEYAIGQLASEPNIQPSRLVRHDVNPVGLHAFAKDCTRLESSGADSSGLTEL
jgi:hypothetical protein